MEKEFIFKSEELEAQIKKSTQTGITELSINDSSLAEDKSRILRILQTVKKDAPELFISIKINPRLLDSEIIRLLSQIRCSIEMDFLLTERGFDKKLYARKCSLLNNMGLVFGVNLYFAQSKNDSLKLFRERLDFTVSQYPNHIDFPQLENSSEEESARVTGYFSSQDIRFARNIAFACKTFYSVGRAVPWFNSVLQALKIQSSAFFADFYEWQHVNNCDYRSGYIPENEKHSEIEKMQLLFLNMKLEEKKKYQLISLVKDIVKLNGAFSRLVSDGEESQLQTEYNPDDLLSPESMDLLSFSNDVCMEKCQVAVFFNEDGQVDYKIL